MAYQIIQKIRYEMGEKTENADKSKKRMVKY